MDIETLIFFFFAILSPMFPTGANVTVVKATNFSYYLLVKLFWLGYSFRFLHLNLAMSVSDVYCALYT